MPPFPKSPAALVERFAAIADAVPEADRRTMFGYPVCVHRGHMFMGLHGDALILRLGDDDRAAFAERFGATPFEPMPGRPMREYVVVPPALVEAPELDGWVRRALAHAEALPPKAPKPRRRGPRSGR